jgi:hypothetical protein
MRAAGDIAQEYVSYGADAPIFGLEELWSNRQERRVLIRDFARQLD